MCVRSSCVSVNNPCFRHWPSLLEVTPGQKGQISADYIFVSSLDGIVMMGGYD